MLRTVRSIEVVVIYVREYPIAYFLKRLLLCLLSSELEHSHNCFVKLLHVLLLFGDFGVLEVHVEFVSDVDELFFGELIDEDSYSFGWDGEFLAHVF